MAASQAQPRWSSELAPLFLLFLPAVALTLTSPAPALSIALWWSLSCVPAGILAARVRRVSALLPLACWGAVALWLWSRPAGGDEAGPHAVAACAAMYLFGVAVAGLLRVRPVAAAGLSWLFAAALAALPSGAGALARPWPPQLAARFFDLSPQVWVTEVAGFDWLRHPAVYERAGGADLGPDLRVPWQPESGLWALGGALLLATASRRRPRPTGA